MLNSHFPSALSRSLAIPALLSAFIFCSPAVAPATAANEPETDRWASQMKAFRAADAKNRPPKDHVLFVGSSSIRLYDLEKWFPELKPINRGFGGSQISDSIRHLETVVLKHEPRQVLLYAGDNDIAGKKSAETVAADFKTFAEEIHEELPGTKISYIAIKPSLSRWKLAPEMAKANARIEAYAGEHEWIDYIDIWNPMLGDDGRPRAALFRKDGLHLSDEGYALWTKTIEPHIVVEKSSESK